jgi:hypothetical protein
MAQWIARALESWLPRRERRPNLGTPRVGMLGPVTRIHNPLTLNSTRSEIRTGPKSCNYSLLREIVRTRPTIRQRTRNPQRSVPGLVGLCSRRIPTAP